MFAIFLSQGSVTEQNEKFQICHSSNLVVINVTLTGAIQKYHEKKTGDMLAETKYLHLLTLQAPGVLRAVQRHTSSILQRRQVHFLQTFRESAAESDF